MTRRPRLDGRILTSFALGATLFVSATPSDPVQAGTNPTFVVDVTHDDFDEQLNDDVCSTTTGGCSLRAAILQANETEGPNRIEFDIPGDGPHTILVDDKLPTLSDTTGGTTIDGYSQPGATPNTEPLASNADIRVIVRPVMVEADEVMMAISSPNNEIRGLSLTHAAIKIRIFGVLASNNRIVGNFIGTDPAGTHHDAGSVESIGVTLDIGASNNVIGAPTLADRNVISGNEFWGMRIEQKGTDDNVIQNNIFGLTPSGDDSLRQGGGVDVQ